MKKVLKIGNITFHMTMLRKVFSIKPKSERWSIIAIDFFYFCKQFEFEFIGKQPFRYYNVHVLMCLNLKYAHKLNDSATTSTRYILDEILDLL